MRVLMFTQKVDSADDTLGVYHEWIRGLALRVEKLSVVTLFEGQHDLPQNVTIYSLGKEKKQNHFLYLKNFFRYLFLLRGEYDRVFVHMNKEYVLLGALIWRCLGKKIVFWYNHPQADWKARLAFRLSHIILYTSPFSASALYQKSQQMPVGVFVPEEIRGAPENAVARILSVGRISKVKRIDEMLAVASLLEKADVPFRFDFYGAPVDREEDRVYYSALKRRAPEIHRTIEFHGPVPNSEVGTLFAESDISLNLTQKGSLDKTIFESMAWGCPVVTSNPAVAEMIGADLAERLVVLEGDSEAAAGAVRRILSLSLEERETLRERIARFVREHHSVDVLLDRLVTHLS